MEIVILGMHRSGTSMVSGIINKLGVFGGDAMALEQASKWNPKGYWESPELRHANNRILSAVGRRWDRVHALDEAMLESQRERISAICKELQPILQAFGQHGDWAVKDPRMCLLLPVWRGFLRNPVAVLVVRNPVEVAESLHKRDQLPYVAGVALWEFYTRAALRHSRGMPRFLVDYNALLDDPAAEIERLRSFLASAGVQVINAVDQVQGFVEPGLYRSKPDRISASGLLNREQMDLYAKLRAGDMDDSGVVSAGALEILALHEKACPPVAKKKKGLAKYFGHIIRNAK